MGILLTLMVVGVAMLVLSYGPVNLIMGTIGRLLALRIRLMHGSRVAVIDGDTIRFRKYRLFGLLGYEFRKGRLRGIDAPESGQSQGPESMHALRRMLLKGGWHLVIVCGNDVYERELMWIVGLRGPVGLRMLWQGQAFATTLLGMPVAFLAKLLRRGMWSGGRVTDPATWRQRNNHRLIR